MPPKKKRGGQNQVTTLANKMSTRSGRKTNQNTDENKVETEKTTTALKIATKVPVKKGKAVVKTKAKKVIPRKKKNEVISLDFEEDKSVEEFVSENEKVEEAADTEPVENSEVVQEVNMETNEVESNADAETCGLTEKLENLNVEEVTPKTIEDSTPIGDVIKENVVETDVALDTGVEFPVEFVSEEFIPAVENSEVIIEEDSQSSIILDKNICAEEKIEHIETPINQEKETLEIKEETEEKKVTEVEHSTEETQQEIEPAVEEPFKEETNPAIEEPSKEEDSKIIEKTEADELPQQLKVDANAKVKKKVTKKEPKEFKAKQPKKKQPKPKPPKKESISKTEEVRRSSRIKSISDSKQRSKGHGLVKSIKLAETDVIETNNTVESEKVDTSSTLTNDENKPVKVKSRWRRSSELEMNVLTPAAVVMETCGDSEKIAEANNMTETKAKVNKEPDEEVETRLKQFVHLKENLYLTDRMTCKEAKKMTCDCFLTAEDIERGEWGCGEDCLNRLLMIECGNFCPIADRCTNKKFQKTQFAPVEVFKTEKKGLGLRAAANIPYGEFILEYVGEVLDPDEFDARADDYSNDKNQHYYFMSLRADAIIDATRKGNISRFINHSCDPNAETQKWTVNGELRIGFFSTRTILAGEEITFDYRFQRYGKEAQKCFCESSVCRGWLGEEPDDDEDEDEEEEEEGEENEDDSKEKTEKAEQEVEKMETEVKGIKEVKKALPKEQKKRVPKKKPRKEIFEDMDQLDDEIEMLVTTGLKNQAHTLKLSRFMVRAKEPTQRAKLLRVLRRGELPCRRLFLDYHGLRLMHGYMTDAQDLAKTDRKYESLRLELLQTLATLPIPNKTMLQDSKVLPTVEKWSTSKNADIESDTSSPKDQDPVQPEEEKKETKPIETETKEEPMEVEDDTTGEEIRKSAGMDYQGETNNSNNFTNTHGKELADEISGSFNEENEASPTATEIKPTKSEVKTDEMNYEEEITALALKLLEEWSNLKEVFKIPKKERIEQMKEHEREANRGYIAGLGLEQDAEKKSENRYRILKRYRSLDKNENNTRKNIKLEDRNIGNFPKMGKLERRKMFALQVEQREEERRRKQREMWRQHEQHCILLGTDPRLTAPFDPNRGYQCIWNPQIGQWQNYPLQNPNVIYNSQNPAVLPALNVQPNNPNFPYLQQNLPPQGMIPGNVNQIHPLPPLPYQEELKKEEDYSQVKFMGPIPPPAKLPPKWKCAKDKYGRPYYYHIKIRKSQWEPPPLLQPPEEVEDTSETTSSSDTSSLSSETSSDESESDEDIDDSKLLQEVRRQMEKQVKISFPKVTPPILKPEDIEGSPTQEETEENDEKAETESQETETEENKDIPSVDARLKDLLKEEKTQSTSKKRRVGLVHEIIISPRTEEDRLQFREDLKRYKLNKEKLKREKEIILQQNKKHTKEKRPKSTIKLKMKEMTDSNSEHAKKIKESFRSNMATVVVSVLNAYRKPDCKEGRITNTEDFKHLARKLTHFVMLKEMKHIEKIEDLVCTDNVKAKAREYIRKYMSKFGENYQKRNDEPDF